MAALRGQIDGNGARRGKKTKVSMWCLSSLHVSVRSSSSTYTINIFRAKRVSNSKKTRPLKNPSAKKSVRLCACSSTWYHLMVEPMSFDRIGNLGKSSTMKARLQEEVRLVDIAQGTRVRYTEMGVFSAVAGNQ